MLSVFGFLSCFVNNILTWFLGVSKSFKGPTSRWNGPLPVWTEWFETYAHLGASYSIRTTPVDSTVVEKKKKKKDGNQLHWVQIWFRVRVGLITQIEKSAWCHKMKKAFITLNRITTIAHVSPWTRCGIKFMKVYPRWKSLGSTPLTCMNLILCNLIWEVANSHPHVLEQEGHFQNLQAGFSQNVNSNGWSSFCKLHEWSRRESKFGTELVILWTGFSRFR